MTARIIMEANGQAAGPEGTSRLLKNDVSSPGRDGHAQDKDARSVNSSAIHATEDAVLRRPVRSGGRDLVLRQPPRQIRPDRRLREIDTGLWEGLTLEEAQRLYPEEHAERERDLLGCPFPEGESFRELQQRVVSAFLDILAEDSGNVLVVAHRGSNRVLLCHLLGLPLEKLFSLEQDYCCVNLIRVSDIADGSRKIDVVTPWQGPSEASGH